MIYYINLLNFDGLESRYIQGKKEIKPSAGAARAGWQRTLFVEALTD